MAAPGNLAAPPSNPDEDESGQILGATLTVTSLALITVLTRLYVRLVLIRNTGWDVSQACCQVSSSALLIFNR